MNVVSFGGGINSTAMLIGMYEKKIPVDLILFADTGAERPDTYKFIEIMNKWLINHGMPEITTVVKVDKDGNKFTLEDECNKYKSLPSIVYGFKKCSIKYKIEPQDKFCNNYEPCIQIWGKGEKVNKYVGYDAGEEKRMLNAAVYDIVDKKYNKIYALIDWEWYREDCIEKIQAAGLPVPGKSSCYFCPSMKKSEIKQLKKQYPVLFKRAITIEDNAKENLTSIKGLGRDWSWKNFIRNEEAQITLCEAYEESDMPCGCYDG